MFQAIAAIIMFLIGGPKIIETIITAIGIMIGAIIVIIIFIGYTLRSFVPEEEKIPKKEENTKIIYIIQNGTGNKIQIHNTKEDKEDQKPTVNQEETKKPNTIQRIITTILKTIENIVRIVLISIGVVLSIIILAMITKVMLDFFK